MEVPEIPEAVSDEYLEELRENIFKQLERTKSKKGQQHLRAFLKEVQKRKQENLQQKLKPQLSEKSPRSGKKRSSKKQKENIKQWLATEGERDAQLLELEDENLTKQAQQAEPESKDLSKEQQEAVKERLKRTLKRIKAEQLETNQGLSDLAQAQKYVEQTGEILPTLSDALTLTEREHGFIKERLKIMLAKLKGQTQEIAGEENEMFFSLQQRLQQQIEQEVEQEADIEQQIRQQISEELQKEGELAQQQQQQIEQETQQEEEIEQKPLKQITYEIRPELIPEGVDSISFEEACEKVSIGESLGLLYIAGLSEREMRMLKAFEGYLKQLRGLKRQQTFDLQHLTGRSIRELEHIFKTYKPQGYINVDLHNVYTRLLTLRSRFSVLLH